MEVLLSHPCKCAVTALRQAAVSICLTHTYLHIYSLALHGPLRSYMMGVSWGDEAGLGQLKDGGYAGRGEVVGDVTGDELQVPYLFVAAVT
jgi:hypothetical protein